MVRGADRPRRLFGLKKNRRINRGRGMELLPGGIRSGGRRLREVLGVLLVALTAMVILALISYRVDDPAPSLVHTEERPTANWVGPFGAHLADYLYQALGTTAWLVPFLVFYLAFMALFPAVSVLRRMGRLAGLLLLLLSLAAVLPVFSLKTDPLVGNHRYPAGGIVGSVTAYLLLSLLGQVGALVVVGAALLVAVILVTGLTLRELGELLRDAWRTTVEVVGSWFPSGGAEEGEEEAPAPPSPRLRKPAPRPVPEPEIVERTPEPRIAAPVARAVQTKLDFKGTGSFHLPPLSLLASPPEEVHRISHENLLMNSRILEKKLGDFGIEGQVTHVHPGPVITMYEYAPAPGIKVNRIANLQDDLAMAMSALSVRVVAPIPGKAVVGIEIPNAEAETVYLMEVLSSDEFKKSRSKLTFALGKDIFGHAVSADLARMPHLLIAGVTGSGKSVMINTILCSILFRATPDEVKFLLVDPKMVELMPYEGIPHLIAPVVTNPKKASWALRNVVSIMEGRLRLMAERDAKNIESYNQMVRELRPAEGEPALEPMPYMVVIIDELADLMMLAPTDVEDSIARLAQMARAVGIHLILATQRPSVNVITGVIKANLPTRISFQVSSKTDSRIILDTNGAEGLLGRGDMLFLPPGGSKIRRVHGAYISESEIKKVLDFVKAQGTPEYDESLLRPAAKPDDEDEDDDLLPADGESDAKYAEAVDLVKRTGQASISMIQRKLRVGYNRAARMVEMMEQEGIISPPDGVRPRRIMGQPPAAD
jgi:S-DNA-T family DNA segregation ATPase FtsK/SpoIIIE